MEEPPKKKILFVITKSNWGGAQRYVFDLITTLPADKFEKVVACGGSGGINAKPGKLWQFLSEANIKTILVPSFMRDISLVNEIRSFFELLSIFKKERPDIIHLNSSKAAGLGALAGRLRGIKKIVYTIHGLPVYEKRSLGARWSISFASWLTILLATDIITLSTRDWDVIHSWPGISASKIHLIPNGIREPQFEEKKGARQTIALHLPLALREIQNSEALWVGTIAELTPNKGLPYFIEAFSAVSKKHPEALGFIIGEGEDRKSLEKIVADHGLQNKLFFTGFIDNAATLVKAFDIFILSSIKEGLPYVILETGLANTPIIATNVGGIPDIIEDMKSGIIVKPKDSSDIAKALEFLMQNRDRGELFAATLKKKIASDYSLSAMTRSTEAVY